MKKFAKAFFNELTDSLLKTAWKDIAKAAKILHTTHEQGGYVYLIGNGGSAAIASHFASDLNKTILGQKGHNKTRRFQAIALPDNTPVLTAWANDFGYEHVFAEQLKNFIREKDALFAISSSGNSANIIRAAELAKAHHVPVVGLVGFDGGVLKKVADVAIHVPNNDYGIVESTHQVIIHLLTRYFTEVVKGESLDFHRQEKIAAIDKYQSIKPLLNLMRDVGQELLDWRKQKGNLVIKYKGMTKEVVSELDLRAEQLISDGLKQLLPEYGIFGEELGRSGNQKAKVVVIDPIDGTKNFLAGLPLFATQIAGVRGKEVLWGIVYLPSLDEMFWAIKGKGSYLNDEPIKVSGQTDLGLATQCFGLGHEATTIIELPSAIKDYLAEPRSLGSAGVHMAYTACGRLDIYIAKEAGFYDIAPGIILCREAGGAATTFGREGKNIIAGNPVLVKKAKKLLST